MPIDHNYGNLAPSHFLPPEESTATVVPLFGKLGRSIADVLIKQDEQTGRPFVDTVARRVAGAAEATTASAPAPCVTGKRPPNLKHGLVRAVGTLFRQVSETSDADKSAADDRSREATVNDAKNDTEETLALSADTLNADSRIDVCCIGVVVKESTVSVGPSWACATEHRVHNRSAISCVRSSLNTAQENLKPPGTGIREMLALQRIRILEQENEHLQAEIRAWKLRLEEASLERDLAAPRPLE